MKFLNTETAGQAKIINKFTNTRRKLLKTIANIKFNKTCKEHNLIPKYIHLKTNSKQQTARDAVENAKKLWLEKEIKFLYKKKNTLNIQTYNLHLEASKIFNNIWTDIFREIDIKLGLEMENKYNKMQKKIEKLLADKNNTLKQTKKQNMKETEKNYVLPEDSQSDESTTKH